MSLFFSILNCWAALSIMLSDFSFALINFVINRIYLWGFITSFLIASTIFFTLSFGLKSAILNQNIFKQIEAISRSLFALIVATQTATLTIPMKPSPSLADCPLICNSMNPAHACHQGRQCVYSIHFPPPHCVSVRRFKCKFKFSFASTRVQVLERD